MRLRFLKNNGMAFLKDFVYGNERLESLYLVCENWLPVLAVSTAEEPGKVMAQSKQE